MSNLFDEIEVPESAGMISFSRTQGQTVLFGSPLVHQGYIRMKVCKAQANRSTGYTWYMAGTRVPYIEVELSYSQFAEAITAMNVGDGVPCTVSYLNGEDLERPTIQDDRTEFDNEMEEVVKEAVSTIGELIEAIQEEKMSQKAKNRLIGIARTSLRKLDDTVPFLAKMYHEHLNTLEQKAKTEIASYGDMVIRQHGLGAIQAGLPALPVS